MAENYAKVFARLNSTGNINDIRTPVRKNISFTHYKLVVPT